MSSSIVMESSSNTDIDTSIVNGKVNEEEEQQLLFVLPEDIVFEILLWLPVVSLLRFKSVCKSWFSLIQTSRFISQHIHKGTRHNNLLLMLPSTLEVGGHNNAIFKVLSSSCGGGNSINNKFQTYENLDLPEYFKINNRALLGRANMVICDGLVCLEYWQDISLWNPATKQFRILPRSQLPLPPRNQYTMFIGFGFDVETNDYKVIRAVFFCPHSANNNQIEVYSLTSNSWKSLNFVLPFECMFCDLKMPLPYHNGGIYCWMGRDYIDPRKDFIDRRDYVNVPRILSFDFRKEIFGTIPLPNDPTFQSRIFPILAILREKLAAIKNIDFKHYQIWVMNEFGVRESWTKLYTVGPFSYSHPMGFPKNEDLFLLGKDQQQVCLCDPVTGQINNLPALNSNLFRVQAAVYKESLLPI